MPGKCRFQQVWLEEDLWRLWLRQGRDDRSAFCSLCKKNIDVSHSGVNEVKSHAKGKKHQQLESNLKSGKQLTLHSFNKPPNVTLQSSEQSLLVNEPSCCRPSDNNHGSRALSQEETGLDPLQGRLNLNLEPRQEISSFLLSDAVTKAEVLWAAYCVTTHTSTPSGQKAVNLFPLMFSYSNIASKLKMNKDKIAYSVTYGRGPYFCNLTSSYVRRSPIFAISIDECLNDISQKQQLDVMANSWDIEKSSY